MAGKGGIKGRKRIPLEARKRQIEERWPDQPVKLKEVQEYLGMGHDYIRRVLREIGYQYSRDGNVWHPPTDAKPRPEKLRIMCNGRGICFPVSTLDLEYPDPKEWMQRRRETGVAGTNHPTP